MESNYGRSESNYGGSCGGYPSESNYIGESRGDYRKANPNNSESGESRISSESRGLSYADWLKTKPCVVSGGLSSQGEMHAESGESRISSESRGLSYADWLKTNPWIVRGGLSSQGEMHAAYEKWLQEQSGRPNRTSRYNSLDDINSLIERISKDNPDGNQIQSAEVILLRAERDERLKKLIQLLAEQEEIEELKGDIEELDRARIILEEGFHR